MLYLQSLFWRFPNCKVLGDVYQQYSNLLQDMGWHDQYSRIHQGLHDHCRIHSNNLHYNLRPNKTKNQSPSRNSRLCNISQCHNIGTSPSGIDLKLHQHAQPYNTEPDHWCSLRNTYLHHSPQVSLECLSTPHISFLLDSSDNFLDLWMAGTYHFHMAQWLRSLIPLGICGL